MIEKLFLGLCCFGILCVTLLIAQCSNNIKECRTAAINKQLPADEIAKICRQ